MENEIVQSFEASFENENVAELVKTTGDIALDIATGTNSLDGIPVLGILSTIYKVTKDVKTYRLSQKIISFLYHTANLSVEKKKEFVREYLESNQEKTAALLLDVIDRVDNINKVRIICNLTIAKSDGFIDICEYNRLLSCIQSTPYTDILSLKNYTEQVYFPGQTEVLQSNALVYRSYEEFYEDKLLYSLNRNGYLLLKYGLMQFNGEIPTTYSVDQPSAVYVSNDIGINDVDDIIEKHQEWKEYNNSDQGMFDYDLARGK